MQLHKVHSQLSWPIRSSKTSAYLTRTGGHLGPITFTLKGRQIEPYSVAPWCDDKGISGLPPVLQVLRGDFLCMPFGGNNVPFNKEQHPVHGEVANSKWTFESIASCRDKTTLHTSLETKLRPGRVDKFIELVDGHCAVYQRHSISHMSGPMCFGHHAMLRFPDYPGSGLVSLSPFKFARTLPTPFENPAQKGYSSLKPGSSFTSLSSVPMLDGSSADLSRFPDRRGFDDLVLLESDPNLDFAWSAVTFPKEKYVWFALKNPRILKYTIFWLSNGGRHYPPWNGRHVNVMGLEEVTSYFHYGLNESALPNSLSKAGHLTSVTLNKTSALTLSTIMGVASVPADFQHVKKISPVKNGVEIIDVKGRRISTKVNLTFLDSI